MVVLYVGLSYVVGLILTAAIGRFVYYLQYKNTDLKYDSFDQEELVKLSVFWPVTWVLPICIIPFNAICWFIDLITRPRKKV